MAAVVMSGREISEQVKAELREDLSSLRERGFTPGLAVVLVGDDPASVAYVGGKARDCLELGIFEETLRLPRETPEGALLGLIDRLNEDPRFHGILVQLPLPGHIDEKRVLQRLRPDKDVDGFHPVNLGRLLAGDPLFVPCTPAGIQQLLLRSGRDPGGKHVVICGRSNIVGKPLAALLMQKARGANATVTVCHTATADLASLTRQADILVAAMGRPGSVRGDMVKEGAVVIDVGVNRVPDASAPRGTRLVGDVDLASVRERASAVTPVPGGVGLLTRAALMANTVKAATLAHGR